MLVLGTVAVYSPLLGYGFINYDDPLYVLDNTHVRAGLTWRGIAWAFTHVHSQNWHPLTSISHMFDCQLFGLNPGAHHLVNVFLHSVAAVLLFLFWASPVRASRRQVSWVVRPNAFDILRIRRWTS